MKKLEKMIQKNLNLEIPMKYPNRIKQVHYWKYCISLMAFLLLGIAFDKTKESPIPNTLKLEDSIVINSLHDSTMDKTDSILRYLTTMNETEKQINLFDKIPLMSTFLKHWVLEYHSNQWNLTYHENTSILAITIIKENERIIKYELQKSMIKEVPVTIEGYEDYYRATFHDKDYFYHVIGYHMEESTFIELLRQMIGGIK